MTVGGRLQPLVWLDLVVPGPESLSHGELVVLAREQAALFAAADIVVGVHGAGLTNIVFAPEGAHIVELGGGRTRAFGFYAEIARVRGQRHHLIAAEGKAATIDPQAVARGLSVSLPQSAAGPIDPVASPVRLSKTPPERRYMAAKPGLESGLMILEYTATALAADNSRQVYPESSYPASVSSGIEDHASHGVNAGMKALSVADNVSRMLGIELVCASNILGEDGRGVSSHVRRVCEIVRQRSPLLKGDRSQAQDLELLSKDILGGALVQQAAEKASLPRLKTARTY